MAPRAAIRAAAFVSLAAALALLAPDARAQMAGGPSLVRLLGPRAMDAFARPGASGISALVSVPNGVQPSDLGLAAVAPGFARLYGPPSAIVAFGEAHPELVVEVAPPLHLLLDKAAGYVRATDANAQGWDGAGVLVGIADTGIDVTHPDFLDAQGNTRVAWLIDYSQPPLGLHPDLEAKFASTGGSFGAVLDAADIDNLLRVGPASELPQDEIGHGTLVASCAAGNGELGKSPYRGVAPNAGIVFARITGAGQASINQDDLLTAVAFLFDRAQAMAEPIVVNLSLGSDFGPHDGTTAWEQTLASYVGPSQPGRALVVAAGNSGSIADSPIHQNVYVAPGETASVPIATQGSTQGSQSGTVQVWVAMHAGALLKVGLDGPDGTWIQPVGSNASGGKNTSAYDAAIYNGSGAASSPVPTQSNGAAVVWQGQWPSGKYAITLSGGSGTADLYVEYVPGAGDPSSNASFYDGVREGTIDLPATSASILSVGCTINKASWQSVYQTEVGLAVPPLDAVGGEPDLDASASDPVPGEPCWFSSAGPTLGGIAKPEIMAPGAAIVGAMSGQANPPSALSVFADPSCPPSANGLTAEPDCQEVDSMHAASFGTSFSSPIVAGVVALLFQHDPTLTQDTVGAALQGGAHPLRSPSRFFDQAGAGEVDALGALAAVDALRDPRTALPSSADSWLVLGADAYLADGSTPLEAVIELRAAPPSGSAIPPPADGFGASRLQAYALVDGKAYGGAVSVPARRGPGLWVATVSLPAGLGGSNLTVGATFDGADVVAPAIIPIGTDAWNANYPPSVGSGCTASGSRGAAGRWLCATLAVAAAIALRRRVSRRAEGRSTGSSETECGTSRASGRARA